MGYRRRLGGPDERRDIHIPRRDRIVLPMLLTAAYATVSILRAYVLHYFYLGSHIRSDTPHPKT
jgi:hypothetical protein